MCAGNHDALRIAEPQPIFHKEFAKSLYEMDNVIMVTNPSVVNIHSSKDFEGFNVLMYHGYSFDYYINNVDELRNNGGYDKPDLVMKFLLQRRHLAPSHTSTLFIPDSEEDNLIIDKIPDFFIAGHIHKSGVTQYNGVTIICGSCFQDRTIFQTRVGHHPEPGRVPVVNLKTREIKIMRFCE